MLDLYSLADSVRSSVYAYMIDQGHQIDRTYVSFGRAPADAHTQLTVEAPTVRVVYDPSGTIPTVTYEFVLVWYGIHPWGVDEDDKLVPENLMQDWAKENIEVGNDIFDALMCQDIWPTNVEIPCGGKRMGTLVPLEQQGVTIGWEARFALAEG